MTDRPAEGYAHQFDTGQDYSSAEITDAEWQGMQKWYADLHGTGDLDLVKFLPFMKGLRPDALKLYRRWVETVPAGVGLPDALPGPVMAMVWLHYYVVLGYREGILYEIIMAKEFGATRAQVGDVITLGWLRGGPNGLNAAAGVALEYMQQWDPADPGAGIDWPAGWEPDAEAFRSGADLSPDNAMSQDDLAKLSDWHQRVQGEVPAYVPFFAEGYPLALKMWRARYENVAAGTLPKQFIALLQLHVAALTGADDGVRRAAHMARAFGVSRTQVLQILANTQVYLGDLASNQAVTPVQELLAGWAD